MERQGEMQKGKSIQIYMKRRAKPLKYVEIQKGDKFK